MVVIWRTLMSTFAQQVHVYDGRDAIENLPFAEKVELTVTLVPKFRVEEAAFWKTQSLTSHLYTNFAETTIPHQEENDRDERIF
jgi:hypothetical protein